MLESQQQLLAQSLALCGLLAATLQYAILLRRRAERRTAESLLAEVRHQGLGALLRISDPQ
jgi:hypothetical protein